MTTHTNTGVFDGIWENLKIDTITGILKSTKEALIVLD